MKLASPLSEIHKSGLYGDYDGKNQEDLIKISEVTNLSIFQVVQLNEGKNDSQNLNISGLNFVNHFYLHLTERLERLKDL